MHRLWAACLLATLMLPLHSAPAHAATLGVSITDNSYSPTPLTINIADTVRWTNNGFASHTSTGNAPLSYWSSGTLRRGSTYSRAFAAAGTYGYSCTFHSSMRGTVLRARPLEEKGTVVRAFEREVVPGLASGRIRALVDSVYPADRVVEAFERLEGPGKVGKVLLDFGEG